MSRLFEQILRGNRIYYHGSPSDFDSFEARSRYHDDEYESAAHKSVFLSTDANFAVDYAKYASGGYIKETSTFYTCKLTKPLDLFNPQASSDFQRVRPHLDYENLQTISGWRWDNFRDMRFWRVMERSNVVNAVRKAGFEGFCTREGGVENIAVFVPQYIKILKKENIGDLYDAEDAKELHVYSFKLPDNAKLKDKEVTDTLLDYFSDLLYDYASRWSAAFCDYVEDGAEDYIKDQLHMLHKRLIKDNYTDIEIGKGIRRFLKDLGMYTTK